MKSIWIRLTDNLLFHIYTTNIDGILGNTDELITGASHILDIARVFIAIFKEEAPGSSLEFTEECFACKTVLIVIKHNRFILLNGETSGVLHSFRGREGSLGLVLILLLRLLLRLSSLLHYIIFKKRYNISIF